MVEECEKCGKNFESKEALEQHLKDYDHSDKEKEKDSLREKIMNSQMAGLSVIGVLVIGLGFLFVSTVASSSDSSENAPEVVKTDGEPFTGSENASVTIAYFGDYNCSACLYFEQNIFSDMRQQIIGEDVRFVKKNFPVINDQSPQLAQASESVWSQTNSSNREVFWDWHANIYDNQGSYTSSWATVDRIVELSSEVEGVDAEQVRQDIGSGKYRSETRGDLTEGQSAGVRGTPTFIIFNSETGESRQLVGPQPLNEFRSAINGVSS